MSNDGWVGMTETLVLGTTCERKYFMITQFTASSHTTVQMSNLELKDEFTVAYSKQVACSH